MWSPADTGVKVLWYLVLNRSDFPRPPGVQKVELPFLHSNTRIYSLDLPKGLREESLHPGSMCVFCREEQKEDVIYCFE